MPHRLFSKTPKKFLEAVYRNDFMVAAMQKEYLPFVPVLDHGIDLILYRESDRKLFKVQLKGRWTIDKKYVGRGLYIGYPDDNVWIFAPHDRMVEIGEQLGYTESKSWTQNEKYSVPKVGKEFRALMKSYVLE